VNLTRLSAGLLLLLGSARADTWSEKFPTIKKDIPGPCSFESTSKKSYKGRTLNIITHAVPVMGEPTALHAKQFEELTGATVKVVHVPFGDLFQKIMIPFQTGQSAYDVLFYGSLWIGDFYPYLEPVPEAYVKMPQMEDVTRNYQGVATWDGKMVQFPVDGDRHYLKYRSDVINNSEMQAKYKKATGRNLRVPETWEEYDQIARFFNGRDWDGDGEKNYGSAEVVARDNLMFSAFISRVAPYAKHPAVKGGFFFDLETMKPLVNTPGWVKGLEDFVKAQDFMPPGGNNFGLGEEIFSFGGGQTLFSYSWDDAFIQAMEPTSRIRNLVGAAPLPGALKVWNRKTGKWDTFKEPSRAPYITWGWTSAVTKDSKNKDMAFDYLCFFANAANHASDLLVGRFGVNPYRKTPDFDPSFYIKEAGWAAQVANTYTVTLSGMDTSHNRVFDLRVPGVNQYMTSMAAGVSKALAKQLTPQQAMDEVAKEWTQITERLGVDRIRKAYANVVALEDN
jgi:multiple sugar transport system substrate-binding protein